MSNVGAEHKKTRVDFPGEHLFSGPFMSSLLPKRLLMSIAKYVDNLFFLRACKYAPELLTTRIASEYVFH